ncbi:MAG: GAF domain-containing sensor histidine kinase [Kordiimonadaceae bacterium]|nr:GAF domain-containing sensor histidine kinase [Kordiimonadaceae bacterium]
MKILQQASAWINFRKRRFSQNMPGASPTVSPQEHLEILNRFSLALGALDTEEDLAWYVAQEVVGRLGFVDCVYYLYSADENCLVQRAAIASKNPRGHEITNPLHIPMGQGITGSVASSFRPEIIADVTQDTRYITDITPAGSEICVPIVQNDKLIGVLDCEHIEKAVFTKEHLNLLTTVASFAGTKAAERRGVNKVADLRVQRNKALMEKQLANESQAAFFSAVSHEFRTPLNAVIGLSDCLAKAEDEALTPAQIGAFSTHIHDAGEQLETLVNNALDIAAAHAHDPKANTELTEITPSLEKCIEQAQTQALQKKITIQTQGSRLLKSILFDPTHFKKIIQNLLDNAVKFSTDNSVIRVKTKVNTHHEKSILTISISDEGKGIAPDALNHIFDPFFAEDAGARSPNDNTGLGLTIAKQFAKHNNASIKVTSILGKGSVFSLNIPLQQALT